MNANLHQHQLLPEPRGILIPSRPHQADHLIVGGGLAGGLIALALVEAGRGSGLVLIEQDGQLGGNHTWSFHDTDLGADERALVAPLVTHRWSRHRVRFPGRDRVFDAGYSTVSSTRFAAVIAGRLQAAGAHICLGHRVAAVGSSWVRLDDETLVRGQVVIDARGPAPPQRDQRMGFQKFVGLELELESDSPWTEPLLMDATVPQIDGYRFTYVLPFTPRRVLVEDTIYSANPRMDAVEVERRVLDYARAHGAIPQRVLRRESGVLPLPLSGHDAAPAANFPVAVGYRGGFFHPVTGYSLPVAARVALAVATAKTPEDTITAVRRLSHRMRSQRRLGRLLNRLMFQAMPAASRWTALDRFYGLPESTIARFYASQSTLWDRARLLLGRPPRGFSWRHFLGVQLEET